MASMDQTVKGPKQAGFNVKSFLFKTLAWWYLFVIGIVLALAYAFYASRYYTPTYTVDARILVEDEIGRAHV